MDHILSKEGEFVVDLESCRSTSKETGSTNSPLDATAGDRFFTRVCSGDGEELSNAENGLDMKRNIKDGDELSPVNVVRVLIDEGSNLVEKKTGKEKRKSLSAKKPPRPPRGLSLDAADQKLIKEIAELAMIKRARIERVKALKKIKAAKASSSSSSAWNGSFVALLFTVFFFFVLLFQGMSYRSSSVSFHDSLQSGSISENRFAIVHNHSDRSSITAIATGFESSNLVEQASGLGHETVQKMP